MKVTGSATLHAPVEAMWQALHDPHVLVGTIPGCQQLEQLGPDRYRITITAGVASVKGTYQGELALVDQQPPVSFRLRASGAGGPGTVAADVLVRLAAEGEGTRLDYDADAVVGGMIGGVGQRMLTGVAKKTAGEFFAAVDDVLTGKAPAPVPAGVGAGGAPADAASGTTPAGGPAVFTAPGAATAATGGGGTQDFVKGAVFGALVALAGVAVGALVARRT